MIWPTLTHRFPHAYYLFKAIRADQRRDFGKALAHYERAVSWEPAEPWGEAFYATLLLRNHRHKEAIRAFQAAIDAVSAIPNPTETDRYALHYSRSYLAIADNNRAEADVCSIAALETDPPRRIRLFLPLKRPT